MKKYFLLAFTLILLASACLMSCDKYRAKRWSGIYACQVDYHYFDITPQSIDCTYTQDIEIKEDGRNVIVLGHQVYVDCLRHENKYRVGDIHNYLEVQFKKKQVFIFRYGGGLGGNASYRYVGTKK